MKAWPLAIALSFSFAADAGSVTLHPGDHVVADVSGTGCGVFVIDPVTGTQTTLGPASTIPRPARKPRSSPGRRS